IFSPAMDVGSSSIVFLCGMPSDAAGPVAARVTPMLISAAAGPASIAASAAPSAGRNQLHFMDFLRFKWTAKASASCRGLVHARRRRSFVAYSGTVVNDRSIPAKREPEGVVERVQGPHIATASGP